jgi:hypothetical protein
VRPRLTFFVELETPALRRLFADGDVLRFLRDTGAAVALALLDLDAGRAAVARTLERAGVPVTVWLLLDGRDGYWLNADNAGRARARWDGVRAWAEAEGLRLARIGLDIEPCRADVDALMDRPRAAALALLRRRRSPAALAAAERAYAELVAAIRATGRTVETYNLPFVVDERRAGTTLLRRMLGLVDVAADAEVHMLYSSYLGAAFARAYFAAVPSIAVGVTGGGVNAGQPAEVRRVLDWGRLEADLLAAARHTDDVYVFSLEGCVAQGMLGRLAALDWDRPPPAPGRAAAHRVRWARAALRGALRAERLLDAIAPPRVLRSDAGPSEDTVCVASSSSSPR